MLLIFFQGLRKGQELKNTALFKPELQTSKKKMVSIIQDFETPN